MDGFKRYQEKHKICKEVDIGTGKIVGEDTGNAQVSDVGNWLKGSPID